MRCGRYSLKECRKDVLRVFKEEIIRVNMGCREVGEKGSIELERKNGICT